MVDPSIHDYLERFFEPEAEPRENLDRCVLALMQMIRAESKQGYARMFRRLQSFVHGEENRPLDEVCVELSRREQQVYNAELIRLSELPDQGSCLEQLMTVLKGIRGDTWQGLATNDF